VKRIEELNAVEVQREGENPIRVNTKNVKKYIDRPEWMGKDEYGEMEVEQLIQQNEKEVVESMEVEKEARNDSAYVPTTRSDARD